MKKRRLKRSVKLFLIRVFMIYLIGGILYCAVDSWINPAHHKECVKKEWCEVVRK